MLMCMKTLLYILFRRIATALRDRWYLQLESLALRHQLEVLKRSAKRPRFDPADRCLWVLLSQWWSEWPHALAIMQADTVRRWRRQELRYHVRWGRRRKRPGRPPIPSATRDLIRAMSRDNRLWGAPRIHGELGKLGITVSRTTVAKYMMRCPYLPSPTWRTFIRNHTPEFLALRFMWSFQDDCGPCQPECFEHLAVCHGGSSPAGSTGLDAIPRSS